MKDYKLLLNLARKTIECKLKNEELKISEKIKEDFSDEKASFVTLITSDKNTLRGCIGSLIPEKGKPLWRDIIENARNAAFKDPRFSPVESMEELNNLKIEISVLSIPKKIEFKSAEDLLKKINKDMGIILKNPLNIYQQSTFLPQVWKQIPEKEEFIKHLFLKAGINPKNWREQIKGMVVEYYSVEKIGE